MRTSSFKGVIHVHGLSGRHRHRRKLSNEAIKCCKCDAMRQTDHNMWCTGVLQAQHIRARAGNRTLNLGIKSPSTESLSEDQGVSCSVN
jgi:hypothetical protein